MPPGETQPQPTGERCRLEREVERTDSLSIALRLRLGQLGPRLLGGIGEQCCALAHPTRLRVRSYVRRREYRPSDVRPFDSPIEQIVRILVPVEDGDIVTAPQHTKIAVSHDHH